MFLNYLLILFFSFASATIRHITYYESNLEIHLIFNNDTYTTDRVVLASYLPPRIYFVGVTNSSGLTTVACRQVSQERVIWGPVGCSGTSPVQTSNCIKDQATVTERQNIFGTTWKYSRTSNDCFENGGAGDIRLCMGPVRLALQGVDNFLPPTPDFPTVRQLLEAEYVFVEAITEPNAMVPAVVTVPIALPALRFTGNCSTVYNQSYVPWNKDNYPVYLTNVWRTFAGSVTQQIRLILAQVNDIDFVIQLGRVAADFSYEVDLQTQPINVTSPLVSWFDFLDFGSTYYFYTSNTSTFNCSMVLTVDVPSPALSLLPIPPLTPSNYTYNNFPRPNWMLNVGGYRNGRLTPTGDEVYPGVPEGVLAGGCPQFIDPISKLPVFVPADPTVAYRFDCVEANPSNDTFYSYGLDGINGRVLVSRINVDIQRCFFPYLLPSLISQNTNPDEKELQCFKKNGHTWGKDKGYCSYDMTTINCNLGLLNFDQKCWKKFNPTTDARYAVPYPQADAACKLWQPLSSALIEVDIYTEAFLTQDFTNYIQDIYADAYYRVPQFGTSRCILYSRNFPYVIPDYSCYETQTANGSYIFPICVYSQAIPELEPKYKDQNVPLCLARVRRYGQKGPLTTGAEAVMACFDGSTGKDCETRSCSLLQILESNQTNPIQTGFFRKCYTDNRGSCENINPNVCKANYPYGPDASLLASQPLLYQFKDFPAACPASGDTESTQFVVNDTLYQIPFPDVELVPCSGYTNGKCVVPVQGSGTGYCVSVQRLNILQNIYEDAYDGMATSCDRPIQPWLGESLNGAIVTSLCNNKGTCCPGGQTVYNPYIGNIYASECFSAIGTPVFGCSCINGIGGSTCTCPVPLDLAYNKLTQQETFGSNTYYYKDLSQKSLIAGVQVSYCPTPSVIYLTNKIGSSAQNAFTVTCNFDYNLLLFTCPFYNGSSTQPYQYVAWQGNSNCTVEVYSQLFNYCGRNETVSEFAGTFYWVQAYRDYFLYQLPQVFTTASFGCTNIGCTCRPDFGGDLCAAGVTSYRLTDILYTDSLSGQQVYESVWAKQFCGENTLVPSLYNSVGGRGTISQLNKSCSCSPISSVDPTGTVGQTIERFTENSYCTCATGLDPVDNIIKTCAGHGLCVLPSFPWGFCEVDLITIAADPLSTPFIIQTSDEQLELQMLVTDDVYLYAFIEDYTVPTSAPVPSTSPTHYPSRYPTTNPVTATPTKYPTTNSPTNFPTTTSPTLFPTTRSPTTSSPTNKPTTTSPTTGTPTTSSPTSKTPTTNPTYLGQSIVFYSTDQFYTGNVGNRAAVNALCAASAYLPVSCGQTIAFISYSTDPVIDFASTYGFSSSSHVLGPTGILISPAYSTMITGPGPLTNSLVQALVTINTSPSPSPSFPSAVWTGTATNGFSGSNCNDWVSSSSSDTGEVATGTSKSLGYWMDSGEDTCDNLKQLPCLCIRGTPSPVSG